MELATTLRIQQIVLSQSEAGQCSVTVADPDGDLVARIATGDRVAARALMARHLPRILSLGRRMLGSQTEAEDVAQEVFLRVWTHASRWRPGAAKFETWLHRVAMNLCYDQLRKKKPANIETVPEPVDPAPGPVGSLFQRQVGAAVDAALSALPQRQKEAIVLCHHQGLSNIDAAEVMSVSVEALESLLARGRRTLKEKLKDLRADVLDGHGGY
ncbi:MAG: RNA polymerase sigma factor [Alphaproteobacteria bacterium]|nr:RNA polymerase sigma factor [Alphaproteobacteria bacterium]